MDEIDIMDPVGESALADEATISPMTILAGIAVSTGDISAQFSTDELTRIGADVVEDYETDLRDRDDWERIVKDALKKASQEEKRPEKTYPWHNASDVNYPLLTIAGLQFNARSYPAIVKGDEAVSCKVVGADKGMPQIGPDGQPVMQVGGMQIMMTPQGPVVVTPQGPQPLPEGAKPEPMWQRPPGAKAKRAQRVRDYMNTTIFYRMDDWEADTDMLLMQLPIVGCAFRKIWYDGQRKKHCAALVHALNLIAPCTAKSCKTAIRLTEKIPDQYPAEILEKVLSAYYRSPDFLVGEEFDEGPRLLLEQHRLIDADGDGYPEPYIVTVDHQTSEVLRIVANFAPEDVQTDGDRVIRIERRSFYVKYDFFPHPEGKFYGIGLGHLLQSMSSVIDTTINQMIDASNAAVAGGGWVGSGVRLQGSKRSSSMYFRPGEYKTVDIPGDQLRNGIVERTYPNISPVMFQLLELMLGAAKDISSVKDVITGEASNNGQVGTTLALIEQGLQVFTAIYKRIYRALKAEYQMLFENIGKYGDEATAADYIEVLDDPTADFFADFSAADMDIRPVSDPTSVTKMQQMARANFLMQFVSAPGVNPQAIYRRAWAAADVEDQDELMMPPPEGPNPMEQVAMDKEVSETELNRAQAAKAEADKLEKLAKVFQTGAQLGMAA
jgi:chaperonin GroES